MPGDMWDWRGDSSYSWHEGAMSLSPLLVMSIPSIAKAKILLCATFNAQVAEHFSQILPFTFPSAADRERIVITSVSVCRSVCLPHRGNVSTFHSPHLSAACHVIRMWIHMHTGERYIQYICRIFWLFYLWSQQQCNKIKLLCVSLSLPPPVYPSIRSPMGLIPVVSSDACCKSMRTRKMCQIYCILLCVRVSVCV